MSVTATCPSPTRQHLRPQEEAGAPRRCVLVWLLAFGVSLPEPTPTT